MTRIFGLCPRCKGRIRINNVEKFDGRKIVCRDCGETIRIRNPNAILGRRSSKPGIFDIDASDVIDDDVVVEVDVENGEFREEDFPVAIDEEVPAYQPRALPKKPRPQAGTAVGATAFMASQKTGADRKEGKQRPIVIVLVCLGVLVIGGGAIGGLVWLRNSGIGKAAKFEAPKKYVKFAPKDFALSAEVPEGWNQINAGGMNGLPISARFWQGSISIEVRESISGGAMAQAAIAGHQNVDPREKTEAPVVGIHAFGLARFKENYSDYNETLTRPIQTKGYSEGRISDFTASQGLLGSKVCGCRATVMNSIHQFTVTCKCPPKQFKDVKPIFEKVVASLSTGGG
jgi:uncharacterized membrane protein